MKLRIRQWLGFDMDLARITALETLTAQQNQIIISLASELNTLRNNLPAVLTQPAAPGGVRRARNWREFAAVAMHPENPKPIELRTS